MPFVNIEISQDEFNRLRDQHDAAQQDATADATQVTTPFEQWLGDALVKSVAATDVARAGSDLDGMRIFDAIERFVSSLSRHGLELVDSAKPGAQPSHAALELANMMVTDFTLAPTYTKRFQQLLEHYAKSAKHVADTSHVGVTNRAYGAMHQAFRQLCDRTVDSLERLGEHRAVGRVEGAVAILVSLGVMDRSAAQSRLKQFKAHVRDPNINEWPPIQ